MVLDVGTVEFLGKEGNFECQFDKLAVSKSDMLYVVSIIAETQKVKAVRAILAGGNKSITVNGAGVKLKKQEGAYLNTRKIGRLMTVPDGYECHTHRLQFGLAQALFIAKSQGFLKLTSPAALWKAIKDPRYSTPVLPEWLPYLHKKLPERHYPESGWGTDDPLLERLWCHRCDCSLLRADTADLDRIVQAGLRDGEIFIPDPDREILDTIPISS